jgi:hypothetical protein
MSFNDSMKGFTNRKGPRIAPPRGWRTGRFVKILRGQYINHTATLKERVSARPSVHGDRWIVKVYVYTEAGQPTSVLTELAQSSLELIVV